MEELLAIEVDEFRKPLEVTFYGEKAQDVGGLRREFFTLILKCILDEDNQLLKKVEEGYVLLDTERNVRNRYFFGVGLICGLSMLEDGPVPCFLEEDQLEKLFSHEILTESEQLFKDGFNVLGLVDLIIQKPSLKFLLRKSAEHQITYKHLMTLLAPRFSEAGSTSRVYEERTYSRFAAYVKEVAAGRRECNVTLGLILRFVTGNETEPIFGFTNTPSLVFRDDLPWSLPRASTCTCQLTLPVGNDVPADKETLLQRFDWAFSNTYFGYA